MDFNIRKSPDAVFLEMRILIPLIFLVTFSACKQKEPQPKFISAVSLIKQEVKHIDTSLYSIKRYTTIDTFPTDTSFITRERFRSEVADFLQVPDLSDPRQATLYGEASQFDTLINRAIIAYTAKDPNKQPYRTIELFVEPNLATGDQVRTIWIVRLQSDRTGSEELKMTWQVGKSCSRTRITRKPGGQEEVHTTKWSWNE